MEAITAFFSFIQGLGVNVMMPILLTIFGTILGAGFGKSLKAGLTVGVGFIGLNLIINNVLGTSLAPAVQEMTTRFGLALNIIDVGWPASSAIAMGTTIGMFIIPLGLLVNILMLITNTTQTIDVDIWNYWHFAFTGSIVAIITGDVMLGFAADGLEFETVQLNPLLLRDKVRRHKARVVARPVVLNAGVAKATDAESDRSGRIGRRARGKKSVKNRHVFYAPYRYPTIYSSNIII